jgi:predicted 3-demethylubiquinone-9 3-methyltransferase (glyoxalase superfamily)
MDLGDQEVRPAHGGKQNQSVLKLIIERNGMQKITPFLWFDNQAEQAVKFYTSVFENSRIIKISRYGEEGQSVSGRPMGSVMTIEFQLDGQKFLALNGGPLFKFTEAISLVVNCRSQAEVDKFWKRLSAGGKAGQCGWLKDRYGVSWQIVPIVLGEFLSDKDAEKSRRVMQAILKMKKLNIKTLRQAYGYNRKQSH